MTNISFIRLDDGSSDVPLYRQLYEAIRRTILRGEFESGRRLPSTRLWAKHLGVSRMTVLNAYEQLFAEGYLEGKAGAGTFVAAHLPDDFLQTPHARQRQGEAKFPLRKLELSHFGNYCLENKLYHFAEPPSGFLLSFPTRAAGD